MDSDTAFVPALRTSRLKITIYLKLIFLCVYRGGTQRCALPLGQRNGNKNIYFISSKRGSNPQIVAFTVTLCAPAPRLASKKLKKNH